MKLRYGFSIGSAAQLSELPAASKADFLELSSALFDSVELPPFASRRQGKIQRFNGRYEAKTLNSLVGAGHGVFMDFYREFSRRCAFFSSLGIREVALKPDWESAVSDTEYAGELRKILQCCFGITAKFNLSVLLELRIPGNAANFPDKLLKFRNSLMYPLHLLIDLHPHEPGALDNFAAFSAAMPFESDRLRLSFDAGNGNYVSGKLLEVIRKSVRKGGANPPEICFSPGESAGKELFTDLEQVMI